MADDKRDARTALEGGLRDGNPHFPGRAVPDEPDRVDRLGGPAGGDQDMPPAEVRLARWLDPGWPGTRVRSADRSTFDRPDDCLDDQRQLRQSPDTDLPGGQGSGVRVDDRVAEVVPQPADVLPGRWMRPHLAVHRRRHDNGRAGGEDRRRDRVAGEAVGHRPEPVRRRRGNDDRVGGVGNDDMADPAVRQEGEDVGLRRVPAQRLEGERGDEAGGRR